MNEQQQKLADRDRDAETNIRKNEGSPLKLYTATTFTVQQESPISNQKLIFKLNSESIKNNFSNEIAPYTLILEEDCPFGKSCQYKKIPLMLYRKKHKINYYRLMDDFFSACCEGAFMYYQDQQIHEK